MANIIKPKKSTTKGAIPSPSILEEGEIASNISDGVLFLRKNGGEVSIFRDKKYIDTTSKKMALILG